MVTVVEFVSNIYPQNGAGSFLGAAVHLKFQCFCITCSSMIFSVFPCVSYVFHCFFMFFFRDFRFFPAVFFKFIPRFFRMFSPRLPGPVVETSLGVKELHLERWKAVLRSEGTQKNGICMGISCSLWDINGLQWNLNRDLMGFRDVIGI